MILVDTSVWVDFFRGAERATDLAEHLESNLVLLHPWVLGELVLGGLQALCVKPLDSTPAKKSSVEVSPSAPTAGGSARKGYL